MDKQKYEREIEEILEKYEREKETARKPRTDTQVGYPRPSPSAPLRRGPSLPSPSGWNLKRLSAGQLMLAAFAVAVLAVLVHNAIPFLSSVLVIVSVVLFLLPIFMYRSTGTTSGGWSAREEKRWRGQVIDFNTRRNITSDPLSGIRRWFRRR